MTSALTDAQKQAMQRIADILREHFVAGICVISVDVDDGTNEQTFHTMHGGMARGIGLLDLGKMAIIRGLGPVRSDE